MVFHGIFERKSIQKKNMDKIGFFWVEQKRKGKLRVKNASINTLVKDEILKKKLSYR